MDPEFVAILSGLAKVANLLRYSTVSCYKEEGVNALRCYLVLINFMGGIMT